jgi:5'-3' exonuclease
MDYFDVRHGFVEIDRPRDAFSGIASGQQHLQMLRQCRYRHLEDIPENPGDWRVDVRSAPKLAKILREQWEQALLFRDLATLRTDAPVFDRVDELRWNGPTSKFASLCAELRAEDLAERAEELVAR